MFEIVIGFMKHISKELLQVTMPLAKIEKEIGPMRRTAFFQNKKDYILKMVE
jgi:hypothetical protein